MSTRQYLAIDLKSFYASVECVARGLDPLDCNLVVADASRTNKTICLAVTPALKNLGIGGRARLFQVEQTVATLNAARRAQLQGQRFAGKSAFASQLQQDPSLAIDYYVAPPRMATYLQISEQIYAIYCTFVAPEDIHVYSIDEVFVDATSYLKLYGCTAAELATRMITAVYQETGITATAGIGTNLYLAKVAMDILAKHEPPNEQGVRIAQLDEQAYRRRLWHHTPLTDFWRVGAGTAKKLAAHGMFTMGDIARCAVGGTRSPWNEDLLYRLFGVNAELLLDHAWGQETCTIADIKSYAPKNSSVSVGQVLPGPYGQEQTKLVAGEMADSLALDLVAKKLLATNLNLAVGFDVSSVNQAAKTEVDWYGRTVPAGWQHTIAFPEPTSSTSEILAAVAAAFAAADFGQLKARRLHLTCAVVTTAQHAAQPVQLSLFDLCEAPDSEKAEQAAKKAAEKLRQAAILDIQAKFGRNALLKGMNLAEGATGKLRNEQVGGHHA